MKTSGSDNGSGSKGWGELGNTKLWIWIFWFRPGWFAFKINVED